MILVHLACGREMLLNLDHVMMAGHARAGSAGCLVVTVDGSEYHLKMSLNELLKVSDEEADRRSAKR